MNGLQRFLEKRKALAAKRRASGSTGSSLHEKAQGGIVAEPRKNLPDHEVEVYPWLAGAYECSERYGTLIDEKRVAYMGMAGALFIAAVSVIGMIIVGVIFEKGTHIVPWVVSLDKTNYAVSMGPATEATELSPLTYQTLAGKWIRAMRAVKQTAEAQATDVQFVYSMLGEGYLATKKANAWFVANNPMTAIGTRKVEVFITGVHSTRDPSQYTVNWVEKVESSEKSGERMYTADVRFVRSDPRTTEEADRNLLGVFVSDFSISELTPGKI
jgi:type IV secretory pathway TrbF-like protein